MKDFELIPLRDDSSVPDHVREHLRRAGQASGAPIDLPKAMARFAATVAIADAAATAASNALPADAATGAKAAKAALTLKTSAVVAGTLGAAGVVAVVAASLFGGSPKPVSVIPSPAATIAAPTSPSVVATPIATDREETPSVSVDSLPTAPIVNASPRASEATADVLEQELAHMLELRRLAVTDPAGAVRMAEEGHRRFQGGVLYQEREAVAILALARAGQRGPAKSRAAIFLASFPESPFAERVRATTEEP